MREHGPQFSLAYLTVLGTPPRRMIEIAAETGYDFVSLRLTPVTDDEPVFPFTTDPAFVTDVVKALDEYDMSVLDVELIRTDPGTKVAEWRTFVEVAAELGARHIVTQIPVAARRSAAERFGEICDLAAPHDLTVDIEFIPWSPTNDLAAAVEIVESAGRPNGGILIDTLHFSRSGSPLSELAALPDVLFNFMQLCDARRPLVESDKELIRVARFDREPPGAADIDLKAIVQAVPLVPYALEVPNEQRRQEIGVMAYSRVVREATQSFFGEIEADSVATTG